MAPFVFLLLAIASVSIADRPDDISMCDFYTQTILGDNTESNQGLLLTLLTNTAIIGNYTTPNVGIKVDGFASPGIFLGQSVELLPYFTGGFASTNINGTPGAKLFLDDGGATALAMNKSSNGNTTSAQYNLITHVVQYFGQILGCSMQGGSIFPSYQGRASMYEIHKFMDLSYAENSYVIAQFVTSAASLGFSPVDAAKFNSALDFLFNFRGTPPLELIPASAGPQLQAICIAPDCPLFPAPDLEAYPNDGIAPAPAVANITLVGNATIKSTETMTPTPTTGLHYGCVYTIEARDIVDGAAASACATGTVSGTTGGATGATAGQTSGAGPSKMAEEAWTYVFALLSTFLFAL